MAMAHALALAGRLKQETEASSCDCATCWTLEAQMALAVLVSTAPVLACVNQNIFNRPARTSEQQA